MKHESEGVSNTVYLIHFFNWLDAVLSVSWLTRGVEEANPLMDLMFQISPGLFIVTKLCLVTVAVEVIHYRAKPPLSKFLLYGICLVFAAVIAWHFAGAIIVFQSA